VAMQSGRAVVECVPKKGERHSFPRFVQRLDVGAVYLLGSAPTSDDPAVQCVTIGTFGKPDGVSRNHVALHVMSGKVEVHDHSRHGTFRKQMRVTDPITLTRPESLSLAGVVRVTVEPPAAIRDPLESTRLPRQAAITGTVRRHVVAALAADHIVAPESRGAYLLSDDELAVLFRFSPDNAKEHLQRARSQIKDALEDADSDPRSREELIDWVKAWREITEIDIAAMDAYLRAETGRGYEDAIAAVAVRRRTARRSS
jgi:FHA domain